VRAIPLLLALVLTATGVGQADITVLCSNGMKAVVEELVPQFERETKHHVAIRYGVSAVLKREIDGGEPFDLAILTPALIDDLIKQGTIAR
jgi:molybdate transport system substrate-binding protein